MTSESIDSRLPLLQEADLKDKVVLVRFDHNVVKKGQVIDPYRIDRSISTLFYIVERGGRPILMTHVGRPKDKKTGAITCRPAESVDSIVQYLRQKLYTDYMIPGFPVDPEKGILGIDTSINLAIRRLRERKISGIYLPNTRWFQGEESKGPERENLALQLAGLADIYVNDAFGSWQAHASTYDVSMHLPSYAGFLMQQEIANLGRVLDPVRPFLAIVGGSKYDTKIGPLNAIYEKVDHLILGGVIYNTYLCAKYGIRIKGVEESDIELARDLVRKDAIHKKIVELPFIVESDILERRTEGKYRTVATSSFKEGQTYQYVLDIDPRSFADENVKMALEGARTIFVNAVMGLMPQFWAGSEALDQAIHKNPEGLKMFGGGDTLQEFKNLCPGLYLSVMDNANYYFFTGGGTVLTAIEQGSPYGLKPVKALMESKSALK